MKGASERDTEKSSPHPGFGFIQELPAVTAGVSPRRNFTVCPYYILVYFTTFSANLMRMVATSARVAVPVGTKVVDVRPVISPSAFAHFMASVA
jgi:hypothetical protein